MILCIAFILIAIALPRKLILMLLLVVLAVLSVVILRRIIKGNSFGAALTQSFMGALSSGKVQRTNNVINRN